MTTRVDHITKQAGKMRAAAESILRAAGGDNAPEEVSTMCYNALGAADEILLWASRQMPPVR